MTALLHGRPDPAREERSLRAVFEHSPDGVVVIRVDHSGPGRAPAIWVEDVNPEAERLLSRSREGSIGRPLRELMASFSSTDVGALVERVCASGVPVSGELESAGSSPPRALRYRIVAAPSGAIAYVRDVSGEKAVQAAFERREQFLLRAQDLASLGCWQRDLAADRAWWSDSLYEICGVPPGTEMTFEGLLALTVPEDRQRLEEAWRVGVETGRGLDLEFRLRRLDGAVRVLHAVGLARRDSGGNTCELFGVTQDVTEMRANETALRASLERLTLALDATEDGVWDWSPQSGTLAKSDRWSSMLGYGPDELPADDGAWEAVCQPQHLADLRSRLTALSQGEISAFDHVVRLRHRVGRDVWVRSRAKVVARDAAGRAVRVVGANTDVSSFRQIEESLRATRLALEQTSRLARIGGFTIGPGRRRITVSPELAGLLGVAPQSLRELLGLFDGPHRERMSRVIAAAFERGLSWDCEAALRLRADRVVWVRTLGEPVPRDNGETEVRAAVQDITEARSAREEQALLFDLAPDLLVVSDRAGCIRRVNPAFEQLTGLSQAELSAASPFQLLRPEEQPLAQAAIDRLLAGEEVLDLELGLSAAEGGARTVSWTSRAGTGPDPMIFSVGRDVTDRKLVEDERRTLALVTKHAADGILLFDGDGRVRWANRAASAMTRTPIASLIGLAGSVVFPTSAALAAANGGVALRGKSSEEIELDSDSPTAGSRWIDLALTRVAPAVGAVCTVGVIREITARKRAELELRASETRFRTIADAAPVMIWITDAAGGCVDVNRAVLEFKGRSREEELGHGWLVGIDPRDRDLVEATFERAILAQRSYELEYRLIRADGALRWVADHGVPRTLADGTFVGFVGVTTDVTDRREAVTREWEVSFDAVDSMMLITSRDGLIERANRAARADLGLDAEGKHLTSIARHEPWRTAASLLGEASLRVETITGGSRGPGARSWAVEVSPVDEARRVVVLAREVSAVVALQDELARHERLSAMGQLVAGVAHEVRNPLFALSAGIDALEAELPSELGEFGTMFRREIDRLTRFMGDLLDFGRTPTDQPRSAVRLEDLVAGAIEQCGSLLRQRSVSARVEVRAALPELLVDAPRVEILVRNLIDNAARFSPAGAQVTVTLNRGAVGEPSITGSVEDEGPGFAPEDLPRLAQPFFSRRRGGTGLGLAIAARVAADHRGELSFANLPQGGARVAFILRG